MDRNLNIIILALILSMVVPLQAQLNPNKITHYDELNGTRIFDILPDRMGNIWIATQSGLVKFDGYEYTRYHPDLNDPTTMGELLTYTLYEDPNGNLWIGCQNGIYLYDSFTKLFERYLFENLTGFDDYALAGVSVIAGDHYGRIYFGIDSNIQEADHALVYYDPADDKMKRFEYADSLNLTNVYALASNPAGEIWILSYGGFFKIDTEGKLHQISSDVFELADGEYPSGIQSDSSGILWITTTHSKLHKYDPTTSKLDTWSMVHLFKEGNFDIYARDIEIDIDNNIWISSNQGLIYFDKEKSSFEIFDYHENNIVVGAYVETLSFDSFGNLWIGTESKGVLKYSNKTILRSFTYNTRDESSITSGWANKMFESNVGSIWIVTSDGTANEGLNILDTDKKTIIPMPYSTLTPGLRWNQVIAELYPGKMLIDTDHGYKIYDVHQKTLKDTVFQGLLENIHIFNAVWDSHNTLWYCTVDGLFADDKTNNTFRHFDLKSFGDTVAAANEVTHVYEGPKNGLWVLTNLGLFLYDYESGQINRYAYDPAKGDVLSTQDVNSIYEDGDGIVWVGTWQGGLCRYNPETGKIKTYSINDGLPSTCIQGILADEKNNVLWLSTFAGISRFDPNTEQFTNFSLRDGMQGLLYADGSCLKTSDNYFIFGGNNGITWFNPEDISKNSPAPKVYITDFKIEDQTIQLNLNKNIDSSTTWGNLVLSHDQNNVSINYTGIQYDNPSRNVFAYKMENYDKSWREVGNQRSAFYYNLPAGNYTFCVKAANSNGVWNEEGVSLSFIINPPWWKKWWAYVLYGFILIGTIVSIDRFQRRRLAEKARQKAREKELKAAKEIKKAYDKLKTTQTQLLHSEKMASLGELTAGIAHEIQNPLNFVNNFSEVNAELIEELKEEIDNGNMEEIKDIAEDIADNEAKIIHHGKRADRIVKGMLQHSRTASNEKEPTDINALADEYLRLSYHGLRAKDNTFNADFKTELDESIPKIKVVPQDIGRVLLNLINNAFHACAERSRSKASVEATSGDNAYKPLVSIETKKENDKILIKVKDNGNGIPDEIKEKIFQPFFTTKSTGEGTGLGLSLSYDIITKGHGGVLTVKTKLNEGSTFSIQLPIK